MWGNIGLLTVALALSGCQMTRLNLPSTYQPIYNDVAENNIGVVKGEGCPLHLTSFEDARISKSLGIVANSMVESAIESWVVKALTQHNISTLNAKKNNDITVILKKAYIQSLTTSMAVNIVLGVRRANQDLNSSTVFYRGHEVDMNWNSGANEVQAVFNKAISNAITSMRIGLSADCH